MGIPKESMLDTREVHHLEGERLLSEVARLAEGDVEPDAPCPRGTASFPRMIP
jgi:hypothetical protein